MSCWRYGKPFLLSFRGSGWFFGSFRRSCADLPLSLSRPLLRSGRSSSGLSVCPEGAGQLQHETFASLLRDTPASSRPRAPGALRTWLCPHWRLLPLQQSKLLASILLPGGSRTLNSKPADGFPAFLAACLRAPARDVNPSVWARLCWDSASAPFYCGACLTRRLSPWGEFEPITLSG